LSLERRSSFAVHGRQPGCLLLLVSARFSPFTYPYSAPEELHQA
jgi:hypothetical protein